LDRCEFRHRFSQKLQRATQLETGAIVFGQNVQNPERNGVVEFDPNRKVLSLDEKPKQPKSIYQVVSLYYHRKYILEHTENLEPSNQVELEINELNKIN